MEEKEWEVTADQARKGDKDAFIRLYEQVYTDLYRFALYTLQRREDAEDVLGDTVMDAYINIGKLRDAKAFRGWIFRILSNKCKKKIQEYQITRKQQMAEPDWEDAVDTQLGEKQLQQVLYRQDLQHALAQLSEEERLIISMTAVAGYTTKEVAHHLQKRHSTVRSKYHRGLSKLRTYLEGKS